jgi:hypothetical protein
MCDFHVSLRSDQRALIENNGSVNIFQRTKEPWFKVYSPLLAALGVPERPEVFTCLPEQGEDGTVVTRIAARLPGVAERSVNIYLLNVKT